MIVAGSALTHPFSQYLFQYSACKEKGRGEKKMIVCVWICVDK